MLLLARIVTGAMATRSIEVTGPDETGTFTAMLPNGETRTLDSGAALDALMRERGLKVLVTKGEFGTVPNRSKPTQ